MTDEPSQDPAADQAGEQVDSAGPSPAARSTPGDAAAPESAPPESRGPDGPAPPSDSTESPAPKEWRSGVEVYDFRRPARISKDRKRSLEAIYGRFVKSFEGWLAGRTRAPIHLRLTGLDQLTFGEFQSSLRSPCASFTLEVVQSPAQNAVVDMGGDLPFYLLDRLLGGPGRGSAAEVRALTVMERQVVRIVAEKAASQLSEVWHEYADLDLSVAGFESIPEMLRAASREDPYLVAKMEVAVGDRTAVVAVAIPFAALDRFFAVDAGRSPPMDAESPTRSMDRRAAESTLRATGVKLSVRLPSFGMSFRQLSCLRAGELLPTPLFGDSPVEIVLSGQARYLGRPGRSGARMAVEVTQVLDEDPGKDRRGR